MDTFHGSPHLPLERRRVLCEEAYTRLGLISVSVGLNPFR